jgi:hypothetical protein
MRSIGELANEICTLAGHINAANHRFLSAHRARQGLPFPGLSNARYIDMHHIRHWANGGETKPSNLVSLCRFHHRAVHEGGFDVVTLDDGALRFVRPDGEAVESKRTRKAGDVPAGTSPE